MELRPSFRRPSDVSANHFFYMSPGKHGVLRRTGLTREWRSVLTSEERGFKPSFFRKAGGQRGVKNVASVSDIIIHITHIGKVHAEVRLKG